jgi:hypothetical protein
MLIPDFRVATKTVQVGTASGLILGANPDRFSLLWWPRSVGNYVVGPSYQVASGLGFQVNFGGAPLLFSFADLGPIVCGDWYGISLAGPFSGLVSECVYSPRK